MAKGDYTQTEEQRIAKMRAKEALILKNDPVTEDYFDEELKTIIFTHKSGNKSWWNEKNIRMIYEYPTGIRRDAYRRVMNGSIAVNTKGRGNVSNNVQSNILKKTGKNMELVVDMLLKEMDRTDLSFKEKMEVSDRLVKLVGAGNFPKSHKIETDDKVTYTFEVEKK